MRSSALKRCRLSMKSWLLLLVSFRIVGNGQGIPTSTGGTVSSTLGGAQELSGTGEPPVVFFDARPGAEVWLPRVSSCDNQFFTVAMSCGLSAYFKYSRNCLASFSLSPLAS